MTEEQMFINIMLVLGPIIVLVSALIYALDYCIAESEDDE